VFIVIPVRKPPDTSAVTFATVTGGGGDITTVGADE